MINVSEEMVKCPSCSGDGIHKCRECNGKGIKIIHKRHPLYCHPLFGWSYREDEEECECNTCKGKGHYECRTCKGLGFVSEKELEERRKQPRYETTVFKIPRNK